MAFPPASSKCSPRSFQRPERPGLHRRRQLDTELGRLRPQLAKEVTVVSVPDIAAVKAEEGVPDKIELFSVHDINMLHAETMAVFCQERGSVGILLIDDHRLRMINLILIAIHGELHHALKAEIKCRWITAA